MNSRAKKFGQQSTLTERSPLRLHTLNRSGTSLETQSFYNPNYYLNYRTHKPNAEMKIFSQERNYYLPNIFCSLLGLENEKNNVKCNQCECPKTEDGQCKLIMSWIQQQYFWKTDPQFQKILYCYNRKKVNETEQTAIIIKLERILNILGLDIQRQCFTAITQILCNYCKHAMYYNKYDKLIAESDIYIWVCLGVAYHIGLDSHPLTDLKKSLIFWAVDLAMDRFEDLTMYAMQKHHSKVIKMFQGYYSKWLKILEERGINLKDISWEWLNEMMFGYMGVQTIGFFLDCFRKAGWDYLYKLILSYFEQRTNQIGKNHGFCSNTLEKQELLRLVVDGKQEWPVVFCSASTFSIVE